MTKEKYNQLCRELRDDEFEFNRFCVSGVIALIVACWVLLEKADGLSAPDVKQTLIASIGVAILYLLLRGLRQFLNIHHVRFILNAESDEGKSSANKFHGDSSDYTWLGGLSAWLFPLEPMLIALSVIIFLRGTFILWSVY